jgi:hypothetical protein
MAQATTGMSWRDAEIEIGTDGASWTDISGFSNTLTPGGGARNVGEFYTCEGDTAIIKAGKRGPLDYTVKVLYTEGTGDPFETVRGVYEAGTAFYLQWSPGGGDVGDFQFTTAEGVVTNAPYPGGDPAPGDPIAFEFTVRVPSVTKAVVA